MSIGDFPESMSQAMLVGTMLVGRLGVYRNPTSYPHPRLQDFPRWKRRSKNAREQRIAWRQESGGGDKFWAAEYNRWDRNPRPQLEPQINHFREMWDQLSFVRSPSLLNLWAWGSGVPLYRHQRGTVEALHCTRLGRAPVPKEPILAIFCPPLK